MLLLLLLFVFQNPVTIPSLFSPAQPGSVILALCMSVSEVEAKKDENLRRQLEDFKHAAELLSKRAEKGLWLYS